MSDTPPPRGRGRPLGSQVAEPSTPIRVPLSVKPQIVSFLAARRALKQTMSNSSALQLKRMGVTLNLTPAAQNPIPRTIHNVSMRVPAGFPSPADDYLDDGCDLNQLLVTNAPATYFYTVEGDSMDLAGLVPGCRLVVDTSMEPRHNDVVIAIFAGEGHTVKRLIKSEKEVALQPESSNPIHKRRLMSEFDEWMVFGVVTSVIQQLRRR